MNETPSVERVAEPRRWAAFHCFGAYSLLIEIHGSQEDMHGALAAGQLEVAAFAAREVVWACARVRALRIGGLPHDQGQVFGYPYTGLAEDDVAALTALAAGVAAAGDEQSAAQAARAVDDLVLAVTEELGFAEPPPPVRHPSGLMPALRMARELLPVNREAHLPLALPGEWISVVG